MVNCLEVAKNKWNLKHSKQADEQTRRGSNHEYQNELDLTVNSGAKSS